MKGSHQNPLSCLSWWPYYFPHWILVLTPLAASSSNSLFFCFQACYNSYPCQEGSLFILSCSHLFLLRHCCCLHSSFSSPSPLPLTQAASASTLLSLVISIHKMPCCFFSLTKEERFLFFLCFLSCPVWGHLTDFPSSPGLSLICNCLVGPHGQGVLGALGKEISFPLHFEVSQRHSDNLKWVLIINHGNSGAEMSGVVLAAEYLVVPRTKLISSLSALSSGPGHHCHIWMIWVGAFYFSDEWLPAHFEVG